MSYGHGSRTFAFGATLALVALGGCSGSSTSTDATRSALSSTPTEGEEEAITDDGTDDDGTTASGDRSRKSGDGGCEKKGGSKSASTGTAAGSSGVN